MKISAFFVGSIFTAISFFTSGKDYHFASIEKLIEQEVGRIVLPQIYKKLGIDIKISPLPGKRAQYVASSGELDGEIMRIWTYGEENPDQIRVPTPYYYLETMAFYLPEQNIEINDVSDLHKYTIAKVSGVKHTNNITKGLTRVFDVRSTSSLLDFVLFGRVQVALTNTIDGDVRRQQLKYRHIKRLEKPLATLPLYHYVHKDHADLVPKIDAIIKEMRASGELLTLLKKAEALMIAPNQ